jgi:hypothetical protein
MATAIRSGKAVADKFNRGFKMFHGEEVEGGTILFNAAVMVHGKGKLRRILKTQPSTAFASFQYGRRFIDDTPTFGSRVACLMLDHAPYFDGKAGDADILIPGRRGWAQFVSRVHAVASLPRWADGFTGAAEALDDLGYAIAESIAAMLAFGIESDDCCCAWERR